MGEAMPLDMSINVATEAEIVKFVKAWTTASPLGELRHDTPVVPDEYRPSTPIASDEEFPYGGFRFLIDYPLKNSALITVRVAKNHFNFQDSLDAVRLAYAEIYDVENNDDAREVEAELSGETAQRTLLNRGKTQGRFGIWGHDIHDLWIERIFVSKSEADDLPMVNFYIGS